MTATPTAATTSSHLEEISKRLEAVELEPGYSPPPIALPTQHPIKKKQLPRFQTEGLHPSVAEAHRTTIAWLRSIKAGPSTPGHWLTLYGSSGVGKTMLATLARDHLHNCGIRAQKWNWGSSFNRIVEDGELTAHLCRIPVLILDDIGTGYTLSEKAAELHASKLYEILEARLRKWTLITTNLSPQQIRERLDARIASRLFRGENKICDLTAAADYSYHQYLQNRNRPQ